MTDLEQAISLLRQALAATPPNHPDYPTYLSSLSNALRIRFEAVGELTDLDQAISLLQEAVATTPAAHPNRARMLANLGVALEARFKRIGAIEDAEAVIGYRQNAARMRTAAVLVRLDAANAWGRLAADLDDRWSDAADGYATAVRLLPLLAWRGVDRAGREQLLGDWTGLSSNAAASAIMAGWPDRAIALLEQGWGVLWSQVLDTRTDLAVLRDTGPQLASQLEEVRAALDNASPRPNRTATGRSAIATADVAGGSARILDERMRLARQ